MKYLWLVMLPALLLMQNSNAETAEEKGLNIAREANQRDLGWQDNQSVMRMVLRNRQGAESIRQIRSRALEVTGDGDKTLIVFESPLDVKGTSFLTHSHARQADDQWLFLPALRRVKRIGSANKSGPFMGSEFAYEDISSQELDKYTYKYIRDEKIDGRDTFVTEQYPQYEHSGYTRQVVWIDKQMYQPLKTEFYDRKNTLLKTLTFHDYKQYLGKYWRAHRLEMLNQQTGKSTTLTFSEFKFKNGFSNRDFDHNSLKRAR